MIRVIGDRVLVALPPEPEEVTTESGLILKRDPDVYRTPTQAIVMALGEKVGLVDIEDALTALRDPELGLVFKDGVIDCQWADVELTLRALAPAAFDVEVGDCVLFARGAGDQITDGGIEYVILHEYELIGIVAPKAEAA